MLYFYYNFDSMNDVFLFKFYAFIQIIYKCYFCCCIAVFEKFFHVKIVLKYPAILKVKFNNQKKTTCIKASGFSSFVFCLFHLL